MRWLIVVVICLTGCGRPVDMVPLNDAASSTGIPKMDVTLYGTGYGPATITMPNGEILTGHYRLAIGGAVTTGVATAYTPRGTATATGTAISAPMNSPFMLQAIGPRGTSIVCQGSAGGMGHGDAVCTTNQGASYQMMF